MKALPPRAFARQDETSDENFYQTARLVAHIDDAAIAQVTQLYRELLPPNGAILDLMSSWISHLPPEIEYARVVGLGMNRDELKANARLHEYSCQDLNLNPQLPYDDSSFDGATICVSVQYLKRPVEVLRQLARVLKADAPLVITFSNRCFPTKAVAIWQALDDPGHAQLVSRYLEEAGSWNEIQHLDRNPQFGDPLHAVVAQSRGVNLPTS